MSAQLTVAIVGHGPDAVLHRSILATLPNDYHVVDGDTDADILFLSGRDGNADGALASAGSSTRAIMLVSPAGIGADSRARLARIETEKGIPILLGLAYAPWFAAGGLAFDPELEEEVAILDLTAHVTDISATEDALLEQLHIARMMMGSVGASRILTSSPSATVIEIEGGEPPLKWRMTACRGLTDGLTVERIARGRRSKAVIMRDVHGRPARISHHDASGSLLATPVYQSGYRAGWIALHAALEDTGIPSGTLAQLESDLSTIRR